jgi:hypothetical protein
LMDDCDCWMLEGWGVRIVWDVVALFVVLSALMDDDGVAEEEIDWVGMIWTLGVGFIVFGFGIIIWLLLVLLFVERLIELYHCMVVPWYYVNYNLGWYCHLYDCD